MNFAPTGQPGGGLFSYIIYNLTALATTKAIVFYAEVPES